MIMSHTKETEFINNYINLSTEAHVQALRYGQYLRHVHNHITLVVAAMDSCFILTRTH